MKTEKQHFVYHSDNRFTLVGIVEENSLKLGLAVCRDGDQFSRKMGRTIAYGRAEKSPFTLVSIADGQNEADLFYQYGVKAAEEKVNEINARLWKANDTVNKYIKEWEGCDPNKLNYLLGNENKSMPFEVEENYILNNLKTSRDDYDFIK